MSCICFRDTNNGEALNIHYEYAKRFLFETSMEKLFWFSSFWVNLWKRVFNSSEN